MQVLTNTDDRLVIVHRPWAFGGLLVGAGLCMWVIAVWAPAEVDRLQQVLVAGCGTGLLACAWVFTPFTRTEFDRPRSSVTHTEIRLTGRRVQRFDLSDVLNAQVQSERPGEGGRLVRLSLRLRGGVLPLERISGPDDRRQVERLINEWLVQPR
ncbi:MAG: hypothetical protein AAGE76_10145 [Pseudomonadota bacterium]